MPNPIDQYVNVKGIKTRFWQAGTQGSAVLLLHGIACSVLEWEHNIAALAQSHRVFAVDLLGFGLTDKPARETYTIRRLSQFVLDFMAAQGLSSAHFAGNSMGGRIALDCAQIAPDRLASQLLLDPAGMERKTTLLEFRLSTIPLLGELFTLPNRIGTRMLWRKAFADPDTFVTDALVTSKVELASLPGAQAAFLKTLRSFVGFGGFEPQQVAQLQAALPAIQTPSLVLWGAQDQLVKPAHADVLRRLLPNVKVEIWERCGHAPMVEMADRFNQTALKFWAGVDAGGR